MFRIESGLKLLRALHELRGQVLTNAQLPKLDGKLPGLRAPSDHVRDHALSFVSWRNCNFLPLALDGCLALPFCAPLGGFVLDWLPWPPRWPHILNSTAYQVRVDVIRTMIEPILLKIQTSTL